MFEGFEDELETLPERDRPYVRRFAERLEEGDPVAERVMRQQKAGELRPREAMMIGGCPRPNR